MEPMPARKRRRAARAEAEPEAPAWQTLEQGIWERALARLAPHDLRAARLTCTALQRAAAGTVTRLELGSAYCEAARECGPAGADFVREQVTALPGSFGRVASVSLAWQPADLPALLRRLAAFPRLSSLRASLVEAPISARAITAMSLLPGLKSLCLHDCHFGEAGCFAALGGLSGLRRLQLVRCHPQDVEVMAALAQLTGLTALDVVKPFCFRDRGYAALAALTNLRALHIGWSWKLGSPGESLDFLTCLTGLRQLAVTKCFVSDADLAGVARLTALEALAVCACHNVTGGLLACLRQLLRLRALELEGSNMLAGEAVAALAPLTGLQHLNLGSSARIRPEHCACLGSLTRLTQLVLPPQVFAAQQQQQEPWLQGLPSLALLQAAPARHARQPGAMEERLRGLLLGGEGEGEALPLGSSKVLQWWQRGGPLERLH